jgi:ABC-type transporter Mla subunit MlaD
MGTSFVSGIRRQVGWFVMLGLGALVLVLLILSVRTNLFAQKFYLFLKPPSAASFYDGQPVKFQGFAIGHVDTIELQAQGEVKITLRLLERYRHMLHEGARAHLTKEGLIGEQVVEVTAGDPTLPSLHDGDALQYETEASLEQLLADLKPAVGNANVLLKELAQLATWMNDPNGDVRISMARMREITSGLKGEKLDAAVEEFTGLLEHLRGLTKTLQDKKVAERLGDSLTATSKILDNMRPLSESLGKHGPQMVSHMNEMLDHIDELSKALNVVANDLSELTPELPGLARESRATIEEMRGLVKGLRGSWLLGADSKRPKKPLETAPPVLELQP